MAFPGGELEGRRPKALCPACRDALKAAAFRGRGRKAGSRGMGVGRTLCFQCYRADLERERAIRAAGELETASAARFQAQLPFEPVNRPRLERLKNERAAARSATPAPVLARRRAQIEARHALQTIAAGLRARRLAGSARAIFEAVHAAELQLPESWLPFVVGR
ncbi:MAG TPA: hypothetical protein VH583_20100 [Vicinamibacterales bacterium]